MNFLPPLHPYCQLIPTAAFVFVVLVAFWTDWWQSLFSYGWYLNSSVPPSRYSAEERTHTLFFLLLQWVTALLPHGPDALAMRLLMFLASPPRPLIRLFLPHPPSGGAPTRARPLSIDQANFHTFPDHPPLRRSNWKACDHFLRFFATDARFFSLFPSKQWLTNALSPTNPYPSHFCLCCLPFSRKTACF